MNITYYEETHIGSRKENQDYYAHRIEEQWCCFIIADGLGGHSHGELAAKEFCDAIITEVSTFAENILHDSVNGLEALVLSAHKLMQQRILEQYPVLDCHTTFALLWLDTTQLLTAHVGDSRIYRLRPNEVLWRTPDHTMVQQLFEKGKITEDDFVMHPYQNRLLRTINLYQMPEPDIYQQPALSPEETILLCTDGFWNALKSKEFIPFSTAIDVEKSIQETIKKILSQHPSDADNITVQTVRQFN